MILMTRIWYVEWMSSEAKRRCRPRLGAPSPGMPSVLYAWPIGCGTCGRRVGHDRASPKKSSPKTALSRKTLYRKSQKY
jgi:hypothetical protein